MSEPPEAADNVEQIAPGVWHWTIHNSNIGGNISASHALGGEEGSVWIDPVRVGDPSSLPRPQAIVKGTTRHTADMDRDNRMKNLVLTFTGNSDRAHARAKCASGTGRPRRRAVACDCQRDAG